MPEAGATARLTSAAHEARRIADNAARQAGVRVVAATQPDDLTAVRDVVDAIWHPAADDPPVTAGVLRALTHAGNYCVLAWDGAEPAGACIGFLGFNPPHSLHSHIAGVVGAGPPVVASGYALKMDQRAVGARWARSGGPSPGPSIRWCAAMRFFNLAEHGAEPVAYHVRLLRAGCTTPINAGQSGRTGSKWSGRSTDPDVDRAGSCEAGGRGEPNIGTSLLELAERAGADWL